MALNIDDKAWSVAEAFVKVMEPFAMATEQLGHESIPTLSSVNVLVPTLMEDLRTQADDAVCIRDRKVKMRSSLTRRFNLEDDGSVKTEDLTSLAVTASCLDPRYKTMRFLTLGKREVVHDHLVRLMSENIPVAPAPAITLPINDELPANVPTKRKLLDCLRGDIRVEQPDTHTSREHELEGYLTEVVATDDPLQWWKFNCNKFPNIAALAAKYLLCIPATEIPSERSFSAAGNTVTKRRASLDPVRVDELLFIHKNYVFVE